MKTLIRRSATPLGAIIAAFLLLVVLIAIIIVSHAGAVNPQQQNGRLITIHDEGTEKVVLSDAATIGDALKQAGVVLDSKDAVEPAVTEQLVASQYDVNIYRARPVTVIDGAIREKVMTPYETAAQIAASAGITLYPEDITTITQSEDIVADGAGLVLTITRAVPLTLNLYGTPITMRTQAKTVAQLLKDKSITLGPHDTLSASLDQSITSGMTLQLWHNGSQTVNVQEAIPFSVQTIDDADQPVGYQQITTPGVNGARTVTYQVDMENGKEVSRTQIQAVVSSQPITQVVTKGIKGAYTTPTQNETIIWNYLIAQGFTREQTAGIMGNLEQEHHFDTSGDGIVQWSGSRKTQLLARPDPYSINTQLGFMMSELNGGYASVLAAIRASSDVSSAELVFQNKYEACGNCMQNQRLQYAYDILATF